MSFLSRTDSEISHALDMEAKRQRETINLIASENYTSRAVLEAAGNWEQKRVTQGWAQPARLLPTRLLPCWEQEFLRWEILRPEDLHPEDLPWDLRPWELERLPLQALPPQAPAAAAVWRCWRRRSGVRP